MCQQIKRQTEKKPRVMFSLILVTDPERKKILLGKKKRGFAAHKWNGFGGKLNKGESMLQCAKRELFEECSIVANKLERFAIVTYDDVQNPFISEVHFYSTSDYSGQYEESEEMFPQWFSIDKMPFNEMLVDVEKWFEFFLKKINFVAHFKQNGDRILNQKFKFRPNGKRLKALRI